MLSYKLVPPGEPPRSNPMPASASAAITLPASNRFERDARRPGRRLGIVRSAAERRFARVDGAGSRELHATVATIGMPVVVQSHEGHVISANSAAAAVRGAADGRELLGRRADGLWGDHAARDELGRPVPRHELPGWRALAGEHSPAPVLLRKDLPETGEARWSLMSATAILDARREPQFALITVQDVTDARRDELRHRLVAQARALQGSLTADEVFTGIAAALVPALADSCVVDALDGRGTLRRVATAGPNIEPVATAMPDAPSVACSGRTQRSSASALCVPLVAAGRVLGALTLANTVSGRLLTDADLELAEDLGRRAGVAAERVRQHTASAATAAVLESALLPPRLPAIAGVSMAARFRPATAGSHVGGDFYDAFPVAGGWMVIMGDVAGKGPGAAAVTALARYTMRTAAKYESSPAAVLAQLNDALLAADDEAPTCTALCLLLQTDGDGPVRAVVAAGGHPLPLLKTAAGDVRPAGERGTLLGAIPEGRWSDVTVELAEGDSLV